MKTSILLAFSATTLLAGPPEQPKPIKQEPPPVSYKVVPSANTQAFVYDQKPAGGRPVLISAEQAAAVINRFKAALPKLGNPRMVIYVNRELVDETSGLKLSGRTERIQSNSTEVKSDFKADPSAAAQPTATAVPPGGNVTIVGNVNGRGNTPGTGNVRTKTEKAAHENTYKHAEKSNGTMADKQTVRDVERLFGRPLRMGGATIADQRVATQLIAGGALKSFTTEGEQARKDREALTKIADVVVEILISSRPITVSELSGDRTYQVPDIQATAVRLSDSRVLAQATASDIIGKDHQAGNVVRHFDVREISEATALALMEDMLLNVSTE